MQLQVFSLTFAAVVLASGAQGWKAPDFCHGSDCPEFRVVQKSTDFEEREYVASQWITTKVPSFWNIDLLEGYTRLKNYCTSQTNAGHEIPTRTWPALITATQGDDGSDTNVSMSWFVPPGVRPPPGNDPSVTWEVRPAATVYVRIFGGSPSHDHGLENMKLLREALVHAGKSVKPRRYTGAGYENPTNIFVSHHNEIWIYRA